MTKDNQQTDEQLIMIGGSVKALGIDEAKQLGKVGGFLVQFSTENDPDLEDDYFTKDTDYDVEWQEDGLAPMRSTIYYKHALDSTLGLRKLGKTTMKMTDAGIWLEGELQLRDDYERAVYKMAEEGKLGWSSGTAPHLVGRKAVGNAKHITSWPLGLDASLTPAPAEFRNGAVTIKSLTEFKSWLKEQGIESDDEQPSAAQPPVSGEPSSGTEATDGESGTADDSSAGTDEQGTDEQGTDGQAPGSKSLGTKPTAATTDSIKAAFLGKWTEFDVTMDALDSLSWSFWWAMWDALYPVVNAPDMLQESLTAVDGAFVEYQRIAMKLIRTMMTEDPAAAVKSIKSWAENRFQQPPTTDSPLEQRAESASTAFKAFVAELESAKKEGRTLSQATVDRITTAVAMIDDSLPSIQTATSDLKAMVSTDKPEIVGGTAGKSTTTPANTTMAAAIAEVNRFRMTEAAIDSLTTTTDAE